jgi:hypothetical protein
MSGIVGHVTYALLGLREAERRGLPLAGVANRHLPSYLAGAYLGCDVQTLPAAICVDTGAEVGYGAQLPARSPITGGAVRQWTLAHEGQDYTPRDIHTIFYGRAHVVFGYGPEERDLAIPWAQLGAYFGAALADVRTLFPDDVERTLAYGLGCIAHVVGDSLIKSEQPGIELSLLNGKYSPENRPIQDLVTFHEVGIRELGLDWPQLLHSLETTPVEPAQAHFMRIGPRRGALGEAFPDGWRPDRLDLLLTVFAENRRYLRTLNTRWLDEMELRPGPNGRQCDPALSAKTGGLTYDQMVALADAAGFRAVLTRIGELVADVFESALDRLAHQLGGRLPSEQLL